MCKQITHKQTNKQDSCFIWIDINHLSKLAFPNQPITISYHSKILDGSGAAWMYGTGSFIILIKSCFSLAVAVEFIFLDICRLTEIWHSWASSLTIKISTTFIFDYITILTYIQYRGGLSVTSFRSHPKCQSHEIWDLGPFRSNLKHDEARFFN